MTEPRAAAPFLALAVALSMGVTPSASAGQGKASPQRSSALTNAMGTVVIETEDAALARALIHVRVERTPDNLAAVGERYYQLGIRDKALEYFSECLERNARDARALDGAARIWRDWGQLGAALGSAYRASYAAPHSPEAWNTLGTILQALDHPEAALNAYRQAVSLDSTAVYARSNLCYLALVGGQPERAIDECSAALRVNAQFTPARNNLALAYAAIGDHQRAADTFGEGADAAVAHYNTGILLLAQREYAAAVLAFEAAYRTDPSLDVAHARARDARRLVRRTVEIKDADR